MSFGNKNLKTKIKILFRIKQSRIKNNTLQKKIQKRVLEMKIWKKNEEPIMDKKIRNIKFHFGKKNNLEHIFWNFF